MAVINSKADDVRALLFKRRREHYIAHGGRQRPPAMKPVTITREQFLALKRTWNPLNDGPVSDLYPDNDVYLWRQEVPFIVTTEASPT